MANEIETASNENIGFAKRLVGVFLSPTTTFNAVKKQPNWVVPLIVLLVISLAMTIALNPVIISEQTTKTIEKLEERGMNQEQIDEAVQKSQQFMNVSIYAFAVVGTFVVLLIGSLIWLFVSNTIMGGENKFAQLMGVNVYRYFIPTLGGIIKLPIMLSQKTLNVHFSLAAFMADASKDTFLYKMLMQVEVFNVWSIVVLCLGIAAVGNHNVKKVWPWVVGIYLAWYLITSGLSGLF